jgi:hypothetical protein
MNKQLILLFIFQTEMKNDRGKGKKRAVTPVDEITTAKREGIFESKKVNS